MNDQSEQSNGVEITGKKYDQVLISVSNPQTAGQSVKLGCRLTEPSSVLHMINVTAEVPFHKRVALWRKSTELVMEMTHLANRLGRVAKPLAATSPSVPDSIINAADGISADLIILGWFGQVTPLAVRKSSVVRQVLDRARCDTVVLKSRNDLDAVERLVVPVHKNYSKKRMALVQKLIQHTSQVVLVHVLASSSEMQEQEAQDLLDELAKQFGPDAQTRVVHANEVVNGIVSVTEPQDLIVVGPGREWVFNRFLFGHNADQLANRASCSVLMYKAKGRKLTAWFLGFLKAISQRLTASSK